MHRDLKPENLMLRDKYDCTDIVIVDFGLASFVEVEEFLFKSCGTVGYVAPEVINTKTKSTYN